MDAETRAMLETSLEQVLTEPSDSPLAERLDTLGWTEVLDDDAPAALQLLFTVKGRTGASADALGPVLAEVLADTLDEPALARAVIVLPSSLHPDHPSARVEGDALQISGLALASPSRGSRVVVPVGAPGGVRVAIVPGELPLLASRVEGIDPDFGVVAVDAAVPADQVVWRDDDDARAGWDHAVARGRWALGAELVGIGSRVLAGAVAYACERKQYGRAIGSFQAVQHRLASAHAAVVGAGSVVTEAATTGSPWIARVAKALAGRAAEDACTQAQQVYGAIGFTWEHEFRRALRRSYLLDRLLGDWRTLEVEIGNDLRVRRSVPRVGAF